MCCSLEWFSGQKVECPIGALLGISQIGHGLYDTWVTMTCSAKSPSQAAKRGLHCLWNPSTKCHFRPRPVISRIRGANSTVPTAECLPSVVLLAPFRLHGLSRMRIYVHFLGLWQTTLWILPIVSFSGQACLSHEKLVKWVRSDVQMTATIVTTAGSWCCLAHHQSPIYVMWCIRRLSESLGFTCSKSRCAWYGRLANRN